MSEHAFLGVICRDDTTTSRRSSCKTGVYNVHLLIILERGCSSMYRKKDTILLSRDTLNLEQNLDFISDK